MAKGKFTRKYNKLLTARNNYYSLGSFLNTLTGNPDNNGTLTTGAFKGMNLSGVNLMSGLGTAVGGIGGSLIGGGMTSGAGNVLSGLSNIASAIPGPWGAVASAGLLVASGITNRLFGSKMNTENIAKVESNINSLNSFQSNASDFDTLSQNWANADTGMTFNDSYIGKDGIFSNKAKKKAASLRNLIEAGNTFVLNTLTNNAGNISTTLMLDLLGNYAAFGGELGTNGSDFTNGIILINNGGTHELNPNEGVIFGMDLDGIPNLVEEGEVIFNNYVFSNRIKVPKSVRLRHRLTDNITFADAAKELAKESEERPNDAISRRGLEYLMGDLMSEQEMIKSKRERNRFSKGGRVNKYPDGTSNLDRYIDMKDFSWMSELDKKNTGTNTPTGSRWGNIFNTSNLRYVPAIGAAIGAATSLASKPDYASADMILEASRGIGTSPDVRFNPIGNYLTYNPLDRDYYINKLNAGAGASRRAVMNTSGGNRAAAMAGILAADNNYLNQLGSFARLAEEYNLALRQLVENFNRATNQYNSEGALKADIANAENRLKFANLRMESTIAGAKLRQAAKDANDAARSTNLTNLFNSLGDIGRESFARNMITSNPANYYTIDSAGNITYKGLEGASDYERSVVEAHAAAERKRRGFACGGYLTIKRRRR